jgi:hypothetical protein
LGLKHSAEPLFNSSYYVFVDVENAKLSFSIEKDCFNSVSLCFIVVSNNDLKLRNTAALLYNI